MTKTLRLYKYYLRYISRIDMNPGVRVVIFGQGRSGSTLLESLIASTGHFKLRGEVLAFENMQRVRYPIPFVCGYAMSQNGENFIMHVKVWHLTRRKFPIDPVKFLDALRKRGWKILFLTRENKFDQVISNYSAVEREAYDKLDDSPEDFQLHVDRSELIRDINKRIEWDQLERTALSGHDYVRIVYEKDLIDQSRHQLTIDRIMDFLNLDRRPCHTQNRKINTRRYYEFIENFDEVKEVMIANGLGEWVVQ